MNDWHEVVPALNSLLITLAIYVFLLLNVEIRNRIHALEDRRNPPPPPPVPPLPQAEKGTEGEGEKS